MEGYVITEKRRQFKLVAVVVISIFMFSIDYSMLNISLPTISHYFKVNLGTVARLPMAYILIVTSSLLGFGKLGDLKGYKKVFIIGLFIFTAGTILSSFSPTVNILLGARALQSVGEAMFSPVGIAMLTTFLPPNLKGRTLGIVGLAQGLGFATGNALGAFLNARFSWRAIFLINVPIALFLILLSFKDLPTKQPKTSDRRFDITGSILIFVALSTLLYALNSLQKSNLTDPAILWCLATSVMAFILFMIQEKRVEYPILDLGLFKNLNFTFANVSVFFAILVFMGFSFVAPFYLELVRGLTVIQTGMLLMIPPAIMLILAPIAGRISDAIGSRTLCSAGTVLEAVAFTTFIFLTPDSSLLYIAASLATLGVAAGIFLAPNNRLVMSQAPQDRQGVASGVYKISANTGSLFGIAILPMIIAQAILARAKSEGIALADARNSPAIIQEGFRNAFIFAVLICLIAFVFSVLARDEVKWNRTML